MSNQRGVFANNDDDKGLFISETKVVDDDEDKDDSETESDKDFGKLMDDDVDDDND